MAAYKSRASRALSPGWGWQIHGSSNHRDWPEAQLPRWTAHLLGLPGSLEEGQRSLLGAWTGPLALQSGCVGGVLTKGKEALAFLDPESLISVNPSQGPKDRPLRGFSGAGALRPVSLGAAPVAVSW